MNKQEFANKVAELVGGEVHEVEKANKVKLISITSGSGDVRPNVYVDDFFESGMSVEDAAKEVKKIFSCGVPKVNLDEIVDYDRAKKYLTARLYHDTTDAEVAISARDYGFDDLIIVPYISGIELTEDSTGCVKVTNWLMERWGKSEDEVMEEAIENAKRNMCIESMNKALGFDSNEESQINEPLIVTNDSKQNGAVSILFCKDKLQERFPNGYTVIPSSIHECLVMPYFGEIDDMVRAVNKDQVLPQEVLSDHAYYFKNAIR